MISFIFASSASFALITNAFNCSSVIDMGSTPHRGVIHSLYDGFYLFVKGAKLVHNNAMTAPSGVILWLKQISKEDAHIVGEKTIKLSDLIQSDFPVPDGFVISSLAYFHFLHESKLIPKITK